MVVNVGGARASEGESCQRSIYARPGWMCSAPIPHAGSEAEHTKLSLFDRAVAERTLSRNNVMFQKQDFDKSPFLAER